MSQGGGLVPGDQASCRVGGRVILLHHPAGWHCFLSSGHLDL